MHHTGKVCSMKMVEWKNARYSTEANFLSTSALFGFITGGSGRRIQTTSPASTVWPPRVMISFSSCSTEACCSSVQPRPVQQTTVYPAFSNAHLMGAVWLSSSAARIMIFIVYLRGIVADVKKEKKYD